MEALFAPLLHDKITSFWKPRSDYGRKDVIASSRCLIPPTCRMRHAVLACHGLPVTTTLSSSTGPMLCSSGSHTELRCLVSTRCLRLPKEPGRKGCTCQVLPAPLLLGVASHALSSTHKRGHMCPDRGLGSPQRRRLSTQGGTLSYCATNMSFEGCHLRMETRMEMCCLVYSYCHSPDRPSPAEFCHQRRRLPHAWSASVHWPSLNDSRG